MAYTEYIQREAEKLIKRHNTRNPFQVAKERGVDVIYRNDFAKLKGMYAIVKNCRFIFINANLPEQKRIIVCGHELGHDVFHREQAKIMAFQEFLLYDMSLRTEYEANIFAAHYLLDGRDIYELAKDGYDTYQIAMELGTDVNLLLMKMDLMKRQEGYDFNIMYQPRGDFLKND